MACQTTNPFTGKASEPFPPMRDAKLEAALASAHARFGTWPHVSFAERAAICKTAAAIFRAMVEEFARPVTLEMGKLIDEARGQVARFIAVDKLADQFLDTFQAALSALRPGGATSGHGRELSSLCIQEFVNKRLARTAAVIAPV